MPSPVEDTAVTEPDWLLLKNGRRPDWGPSYTETPADPYAPDARAIAEPWNTATATLFVFIALYFVWRARGRYREFPFLTTCMPILLTGAIGGVLFHGTRTRPLYFLLDVVPISLLGLMGSLYIALRLWGKWTWAYYLPGVAIFYIAVNRLFFKMIAPVSGNWSVNLSYASLAVIILTPIGFLLVRTRFRHAGWVALGLVSFGIAWFFRLIDLQVRDMLPMGSHWLWHTFGALSTAAVIQFFYRVEGDKPAPAPAEPLQQPSPPS